MTKSEKKIADLEKRVKELEARPAIVILPAPVSYPVYPVSPFQPFNPWNPYQYPRITCNDGVSYTSNGPGAQATWSFR